MLAQLSCKTRRESGQHAGPTQTLGPKGTESVRWVSSAAGGAYEAASADSGPNRLLLSTTIHRLAAHPIPDTHSFLCSRCQSTEESATHTHASLLVLLARRLVTFSTFPYGAMVNPFWEKTWAAYADSLVALFRFTAVHGGPESTNINKEVESALDESLTEDLAEALLEFEVPPAANVEFVRVLSDILALHQDNLVDTNRAIKETGFDMGGAFLNEHLRERILLQLICQNHIAMSRVGGGGIVNEKLNPIDTLSRALAFVSDMAMLKYGEVPEYHVTRVLNARHDYNVEELGAWTATGWPDACKTSSEEPVEEPIAQAIDTSASGGARACSLVPRSASALTFPYIQSHLQYVLQELLKNATRATIESGSTAPIQVMVTLTPEGAALGGYEASMESTKSSVTSIGSLGPLIGPSTPRAPLLQVRITDSGGGIDPRIHQHLWDYSYTTVDNTLQDTTLSSNIIAGMGYGLPLSQIYCRLFGGDIRLTSVHHSGTSVYAHFRGF